MQLSWSALRAVVSTQALAAKEVILQISVQRLVLYKAERAKPRPWANPETLVVRDCQLQLPGPEQSRRKRCDQNYLGAMSCDSGLRQGGTGKAKISNILLAWHSWGVQRDVPQLPVPRAKSPHVCPLTRHSLSLCLRLEGSTGNQVTAERREHPADSVSIREQKPCASVPFFLCQALSWTVFIHLSTGFASCEVGTSDGRVREGPKLLGCLS